MSRASRPGLVDTLSLGNLDARRDWGFAGDYVRAMWLMLQRDAADDYVIASGESHSVRELVEIAFAHAGLDWREHVRTDPALLRPAEVEHLIGDPARAEADLAWRPSVDFEGLVRMMVDADVERLAAGWPVMRLSVTVENLKERLSEYLAHVKAGNEVVVTERGLPVARLAAMSPGERPSSHREQSISTGDTAESVRGIQWTGDESPRSACSIRIAEAGTRPPARGVARAPVRRTARRCDTRDAARRPRRGALMFWDSSAVVPLIVPAAQSKTLTGHLASDGGVTVWRGTPVECAAALYRSHREALIGQAALDAALVRLHAFTDDADTVMPSEYLRRRANEVLAVHALRAADAFQLAAALAWCEGQPRGERLLSLADRLREAARREGFTVLP